MSTVLIVNTSSLDMPAAGQRAYYSNTNVMRIKKKNKKQFHKKFLFYSTLAEFEDFFLCERILINVTTCQSETLS
jgi:hypothetical protein